MTRTTLDLDPAILATARARAAARGTTIGREVSHLASVGLAAEEPARATRRGPRGLRLAPSTPGHVITNEMVADAESD